MAPFLRPIVAAGALVLGTLATMPALVDAAGPGEPPPPTEPTVPSGDDTGGDPPADGTDPDELDPPSDPEPADQDEPEADRDAGFPTEPPPGFTEQQYRRFIDVVSACGLEGDRVCELVLDITGNEGFAEFAQWVYDVPLRLLVIAAIAFFANRLLRRAVTRYVMRAQSRGEGERIDLAADPERVRRDALRAETVAGTIGGAATIAIAAIAAMIALGELGVTLGPLLAGAGIVGIALGFGAQNLVRDVLAGLFVIMEDQYGVGDIIDAGRATGKVEGLTLRITKLRDIEGTLWFVPNGVVSEIGNRSQLWSRAIIDFDIDYRADHERAGEIIKATADRLWHDDDAPVRILEEPELWGVENLGDSSVVIRLAVKTAPAEQWTLSRMMRSEVKKALDAEGIEIPFPQHTIWVHGDAGSETNGTPAGAVARDAERTDDNEGSPPS